MIDLTPLDVRKKKGDFRKKPLGGYDTEEVDNFLELVEDRLEELVRENLSLTERLSVVKARLEMLEGREGAVQEALVSAQEIRKEVQEQTRRDAEALEGRARREIELRRKEAEAEIEGRFREAEAQLKERQLALEELERNRRKFLKAFRSLLEREMDAVEVEEARRPLEDAPLDLQFGAWEPSEVAPARSSGDGDEGEGGETPEPLWLSSLLKQEEGAESVEGEEGSGPSEEEEKAGHLEPAEADDEETPRDEGEFLGEHDPKL